MFGMLAVAGLGIDVRGDAAEHELDFEPWLSEPLQQGCRERAVAALSVIGDVIGRGRVGNHHPLGLVDARKAACHGGGTRGADNRLLQAIGQRIIAAGVENQNPHAVDALQRSVHLFQGDHLEADTELVLQLGIDRHQKIAALVLHGMAGIEEQRRIGVDGQPRELLQLKLHVAPGRVDCGHNPEVKLLQYRRNVLRVVARIGKRHTGRIVGGVSHHQRDAALSSPGVTAPTHHRKGDCGDPSYPIKQALHDGPFEAARIERSSTPPPQRHLI